MAKTAQITVRLTDEELSMIRNIAAQQSLRMSDVVRKALARRGVKASLLDMLQLVRPSADLARADEPTSNGL
jgi:hypothetical protein